MAHPFGAPRRAAMNHAGDGGRDDEQTFPMPKGWVLIIGAMILASWAVAITAFVGFVLLTKLALEAAGLLP